MRTHSAMGAMIIFEKHFRQNKFPAANEADWQKAVDNVLKNRDLRDKIVYTEKNAPTADDPGGLPGSAPFTRGTDFPHPQHPKSENGRAPAWQIATRIQPERYAMQSADIEADIATDLQNGVNAILLDLSKHQATDLLPSKDLAALLAPLCKQILPQASQLLLRPGLYGVDALHHMLDIVAKCGTQGKKSANVFFDYDPLAIAATHDLMQEDIRAEFMPDTETLKTLFAACQTNPHLRLMTVSGMPYHNAGADEVTELACMLATCVFYARQLEDAGTQPATALPHITLTCAADTDFFATIAKCRAARTLWSEIVTACNCPDMPPQLHAEGSERSFSTADPWVNILRATIATFAAGIGGANIITTAPCTAVAEQDNSLTRRIARNTQLILQEESHIGRVMDAAGGSWYVEQQTQAFCHAAWALFQQIEAQGGMAEALGNGFIAAHIAAIREKRQAAIATRDMPILGVSEFPNLAEAPLRPRPINGTGALAEARLATDFEALRLAAQAAPVRPKVFLATLGTSAQFLPRANFAVNLFATGGIEATIGTGGIDLPAIVTEFTNTDTGFAILCGTDTDYQTHAENLVQALRKNGAIHIWLIGKDINDIKHVDAYIYPACDVFAALQQAHSHLGLSAIAANKANKS